LATAIAEVEQDFDYVVFDCPPRPHLSGFAPLIAATHVVIPILLVKSSLKGMTSVAQELEIVRERFNPSIRLSGYLFSKVKKDSVPQQTVQAVLVKQVPREHLFDTMIPEWDTFLTATGMNKPVTVHAPRSRAAQAIRAFANELIRRDNESNVIPQRAA
jgi:chromosome partitioning protein